MATSGITINQLSRDDIINAALRKLVVIGEGQTANASQITTASQALNNIVAEFRTLGMSIWARKEYLITFVSGQKDYVMGIGQPLNTPYPLHVYSAMCEQPPDFNLKIDMNILSFVDFTLLPNTSTGTPVNVVYQPKINTGVLSVWPTPDDSMIAGTRVRLTYQAPFEYFITGVDTPDFPEEWNNALIYTLACVLSDEMGTPAQKQAWLEKQADKHTAIALSGGTEDASMFIQKDWAGEW